MALKWGDDKLIFEEAGACALMATASTAALISPFTDPKLILNLLSFQRWGFAEALYISILVIAFISVFFMVGFQKSEFVIDGMEYIDDHIKGRLAMQLNERKLMSQEQRDGKVKGLVIGGVELSRKREVGQIIIVGLPGSGKSALVDNINYQYQQRNETKIVLHDVKGDFTKWVYREENSVLLGPWDSRFYGVDMSRDIKTPEDAISFGSIIARMGQEIAQQSGASKYFSDAVQELVGAYIMYLQRTMKGDWAPDNIAVDLLDTTGKVFVEKARLGNPMLNMGFPESMSKGDQMKNVISSLSIALGWFPPYAAACHIVRNADGTLNRDESRLFSVKDWMSGTGHTNIRNVFFNNNKNYESRAEAIFGMVISSMTNYINSPEMPARDENLDGGLVFIIDESPALGSQVDKKLTNIAELGRSKQVITIKAMQDESQSYAMLGKDTGRVSKSVQQTMIYFKTADETASELSKQFGNNTLARMEGQWLTGASGKRVTKVSQPVIDMSEFTGLKVIPEPTTQYPQAGVEMIVKTDDIIVKLLQPFIDKKLKQTIAEAVVLNDKFVNGIHYLAEEAENRKKGMTTDDYYDLEPQEYSTDVDADLMPQEQPSNESVDDELMPQEHFPDDSSNADSMPKEQPSGEFMDDELMPQDQPSDESERERLNDFESALTEMLNVNIKEEEGDNDADNS